MIDINSQILATDCSRIRVSLATSFVLALLCLGGVFNARATEVLYYITTTNSVAPNAGDSLRKINTDGTGAAIVFQANTLNNMLSLAVDFENNKAYITENFTNQQGIYVVDLSSPTPTPTLFLSMLPYALTGMAIDTANGYLYVTRQATGNPGAGDSLLRIKLSDATVTTIFDNISEANNMIGLALDTVNQQLYFCDNLNTNRWVYKVSTTPGSTPTRLYNYAASGSSGVSTPQLEVDPANSYLYFAMVTNGNPSFGDSIRRVSSIDGSGMFALVDNNTIKNPVSLALDKANGQVFIGDNFAGQNGVYKVGLSGGTPVLVHSDPGLAITAMVLHHVDSDTTPPTVAAITRALPNPLPASEGDAIFSVAFSETVTGFDTSDLLLTTTGTAAGVIQSVSAVDGSNYNVSVVGLSGDGTLRLDLKGSGTGIADLSDNAISGGFNSGETYTLDHTAPSIISIVRQSPSGSNVTSAFATWRVTFSEPVSGVDLNDFTFAQVGGNGTVWGASVSGGPTVYDVTGEYVNGVSPYRLDLNATETGIADLSDNAISGGYTAGEIYYFDNEGPVVDWVDAPANGAYRAGQSLQFTIHYYENTLVTGTPSIGLTIGSTARSAGYVSGSGTRDIVFRYTVQAGESDSDGVASDSIISLNGGTIKDGPGNDAALAFDAPSTTGVLVDAVAPQIISITRQTPGQQTVATNRTVFTVTFSENVTGVSPARFSVTPVNGSTVSGTVASVSGGPKVYGVTVNLTSGTGEFRLDVATP